jgi:ADP-ribosyl-[dinitrogen reductase] hydrolase
VQRLTEFEHHVIGDVDQRRDRADAAALEAALWCFAQTDSFAPAVLMAANLGDDADTTAAICGQIAGAYYGVDAIPAAWREQLARRQEIEELALALAASPSALSS